MFLPTKDCVLSLAHGKLPRVLDANGKSMYAGDDYTFVPGKDEVVRVAQMGM